eukprot:169334-Rhodomonas_salina.1
MELQETLLVGASSTEGPWLVLRAVLARAEICTGRGLLLKQGAVQEAPYTTASSPLIVLALQVRTRPNQSLFRYKLYQEGYLLHLISRCSCMAVVWPSGTARSSIRVLGHRTSGTTLAYGVTCIALAENEEGASTKRHALLA